MVSLYTSGTTSTATIWNYWTNNTTSTVSTTIGPSNTIWGTWAANQGYGYTHTGNTTIAASGASDTAWRLWYRDTLVRDTDRQHDDHVGTRNRHMFARPPECAHIEAWHKELRRRELETRRKARKQSLRLLYEYLTKEQWHQLKFFGFFDVIGGKSGDVYRLHWQRGDSMAGNVEVLKKAAKYVANDNFKERQLKAVLCAHAPWAYTIGDQLLSQKLLIQFDEERFLKTALHHGLVPRQKRRLLKAA